MVLSHSRCLSQNGSDVGDLERLASSSGREVVITDEKFRCKYFNETEDHDHEVE